MRRNSSLISQDADVFEDTSVSRVQVYVRIRPIVQGDVTSITRKGAVSVEATDLTQVRVADGKKEKIFQFDQVLPPEASNAEVYQVVGKPLVEASMTGLNSILMAYGQTGAGKTHTLMASADGLTTSVVSHIFALIGKDAAHSYAVTCSYLQIYQERVYDLLASEKSGTEVFLREHPKKGVYVENLSEYSVKSPEEIVRLLKSGKRRLAVAETKMNRQSSRLLPAEEVTSLATVSDKNSWGKDQTLFFSFSCDLAGSERVKKTKAAGERLQEAQSINSSLLELGNVIQALAEGTRRHIPYRNSVLTRLLQDGLDGNSKTSLIVCVSPSFRDVNETLCSLKFGLRAMKIHNVAQVNVNEVSRIFKKRK
ncbi:unnamed protein product [Porites evermanni]|uniref:Kinesin motor domain-containing protein n=1 Tax=Porites evermanni TaxID=104178 RepID=A0ABN8SHW7_9CNID|nr:unnamed protein product [Porites evermanni]